MAANKARNSDSEACRAISACLRSPMSVPIQSSPAKFPLASSKGLFVHAIHTLSPLRRMFSFSFWQYFSGCAKQSRIIAARSFSDKSVLGIIVPIALLPIISASEYPKKVSANSLKKVILPSLSNCTIMLLAFSTSCRYLASLSRNLIGP